jgi:mannan endo-1,4-beta-mannosidase
MWRFLRACAAGVVPAHVVAVPVVTAAVIATVITGCANPAYRDPNAPKPILSPADSRPVQVSLPATPASYFGVFEPSVQNDSYSQVARFAKVTGIQPNLVLEYTYWGEPFATNIARQAEAHGATVVDDLDPTGPSVASIAAGDQDGYLEAYAEAVRSFGGPVIISFGHEMNGNWYSWGWTNTRPSVFVRAWRRIVNVFRVVGADNVTWLWTVNLIIAGGPSIRDWWPGGNYVTWVGIDGYLAEQYMNFSNTFAPTVSAIRQITAKPILISETAVGQLAGQAAGIPGLFAGVRRAQLLGLIWFDKAQSGGTYAQDWRLEGHPASEDALREAVKRYLDEPSLQLSDRTAG